MAINAISPKFDTFFRRALALLRVETRIGGLEISDTVLRYTHLEGEEWKLYGLRLPPGIVEDGIVKDRAQFVEALRTLKEEILGASHSRETMNVVVSLSSITIYSQVFSLPVVSGENLEKAIQLNVQMISPDDSANMYSGWQLVGEDQKSVRLEVLSAFINKAAVDEMKESLLQAGFIAFSLESRALSLARLVRTMGSGFDTAKAYVVLNLDSSGLELLIIRYGQLYFEYFSSWKEIETESHEISDEAFQNLVLRNLYQVINFYNAHWVEPINEILVSAPGLTERVVQIVSGNMQIPVREFVLMSGQEMPPDWFVAIGSGLRGVISRRRDKELSLLGSSAQDEYRRHQMANFLRFWRLVIPVSMSVLLIAALAVYAFLARTEKSLALQAELSATQGLQNGDAAAMRERIAAFNRLVGQVDAATAAQSLHFSSFDAVNGFFGRYSVAIMKFQMDGPGQPIQIQARAKTQDDMLHLKSALDKAPDFKNCDIPLLEVQADSQGVSFSVTCSLIESKTP